MKKSPAVPIGSELWSRCLPQRFGVEARVRDAEADVADDDSSQDKTKGNPQDILLDAEGDPQ